MLGFYYVFKLGYQKKFTGLSLGLTFSSQMLVSSQKIKEATLFVISQKKTDKLMNLSHLMAVGRVGVIMCEVFFFWLFPSGAPNQWISISGLELDNEMR